jgi:hypothetical protein
MKCHGRAEKPDTFKFALLINSQPCDEVLSTIQSMCQYITTILCYDKFRMATCFDFQ